MGSVQEPRSWRKSLPQQPPTAKSSSLGESLLERWLAWSRAGAMQVPTAAVSSQLEWLRHIQKTLIMADNDNVCLYLHDDDICLYIYVYGWMLASSPMAMCKKETAKWSASHVMNQWEQGKSNTLYLNDTQNCVHPSAKHFLSQGDSWAAETELRMKQRKTCPCKWKCTFWL